MVLKVSICSRVLEITGTYTNNLLILSKATLCNATYLQNPKCFTVHMYLYGARFSGDTILYYLCGFRRGPLATKTGLFAKKKVMKLLGIYTGLCTANRYSISFTLKDNLYLVFCPRTFLQCFALDSLLGKKPDTKPLTVGI